MSRPKIESLETALGHSFASPELLQRALTHASADETGLTGAYERLEFLGDRVLGLVVADMLYGRFPNADEGELARRFNALVQRETVADAARAISLGSHLVLGTGEAQAGGRTKTAILADACEAVLAAVYLDAGLEQARRVIERLWRVRIEAQTDAPRDPKTALQEWSQGRGLGLPVYREVGREGPHHAPRFTVEVCIPGMESVTGVGGSKREAERAAAEALLERRNLLADG